MPSIATLERTQENIVAFWSERAEQFGADAAANTPDKAIHQVEIANIRRILEPLPAGLNILDLACANGHTTALLSELFPQHRFLGGDLSPKMIEVACRRVSDATPNLRFEVIDLLDLSRFAGKIDVVITVRGLLNLPGTLAQWQAIKEIATALKPGGHYIAIENFKHAQENLNAARRDLGLPEIGYRWHNCWFEEPEFRAECERYFALEEFTAFSSTYYMVTRLLYSKLCQMEGREPDYDHPMYEIAANMPAVGDFGPVKLSHWTRR